jgi:AraC-like DNA-binding protein
MFFTTTKGENMKDELVEHYAPLLKELLPLARKAYGSRSTVSPQHDASREYTRLLVEYYNKGGSLIAIAQVVGVTYAGVRRRVTTSDITPSSKRNRSRATETDVALAVERIKQAKLHGVDEYHEALRREYEDNGISLTKIAKAMGLSSSNPLYYGVARTKIKKA